MSFIKKTWLARIGVGLNRFRMNNSSDVVLESNPISVTQQGDQLSADNMNNLETRIGNAFDEMAGNLATIEVSPSQHNWTVGSQIVYNGILYKVTSAISTDDNLVVGTNIEPYPVSSALSDIIVPINYSSITILNNNVSFSDTEANCGFKIGNFVLYHLSLNFSASVSNASILSFPYVPTDYTRIVYNHEQGSNAMPFVSKNDGALFINGTFASGQVSIMVMFKTN